MKQIRSIMGRRQFMIAAGMTSTAVLAGSKISGVIDPLIQTGAAEAMEKAGTAAVKGSNNKYPYLLSPLRVRNKVLKNRIMFTPALPMRLQGPERYPADPVRSFYSEIAKNAALVTMSEKFGEIIQGTGSPPHNMSWEDTPTVRNYLDQMIEDMHCEGSLIVCGRISGNTIEEAVTNAKKAEDTGYDAVELGERAFTGIESVRAVLKQVEAVRKATGLIIVAVMLPYTPGKSRGAPQYNWAGSLAAGAGTFPAGPGPTGSGPSGSGQAMSGPPASGAAGSDQTRQSAAAMGPDAAGPEMEEIVRMAKLLEGLADVLRMKDRGHATNHPNSYNMERGKPWMLPYAQAIKESGNSIITAPNGGFHDPDLNEQWIARGKTDMVAVATPLLADPEYVKKVSEGRAEDIVPCVSCHDCHNRSRTIGPWHMTCAVNPMFGLTETKKKSIRPAAVSKKVAVIGGGPAGMKAAITAAERGHRVTLYEKSDSLGGLQQYTDLTPYRWTYKDFKDYLIRQVKKAGVEVHLKTTATPEMIKAKGYDTVLAATGAEPITSKIPGADGKNVYDILSVFADKKALGKNVVFAGGGLFGVESALSLVLERYKVTMLTSEKQLIGEEYIGSHNRVIQIDIAVNNPDFSYVVEATATRISDGKVFYKDATGSEKSVQADSVVIYAGLKPRTDEAIKFSGSASHVLPVGDCTGRCGMLYKTIRNAFFTASQV